MRDERSHSEFGDDPLFAPLRADLELTPSASFEASVLKRLDEAETHEGGWDARLWFGVAAAIVVVVVGVLGLRNRLDLAPPVVPASTAVVPLPYVEPLVVPSEMTKREAALAARVRAGRPSRSTRLPVDHLRGAQPRPFEDVVMSASERRGVVLLMTHRLPDDAFSRRSIDDPVQVVALSEIAPITIRPIGGATTGGAPVDP